MSVDSLRKNRAIAWIDEKNFKDNEYGPPTFDETKRAYFWRMFKRGFTWGFLLSTSVLVQFQYLQYLLKPGMIQPQNIIIQPIMLGSLIGAGLGIFEYVNNPQIAYQPAAYQAAMRMKQLQAAQQQQQKNQQESGDSKVIEILDNQQLKQKKQRENVEKQKQNVQSAMKELIVERESDTLRDFDETENETQNKPAKSLIQNSQSQNQAVEQQQVENQQNEVKEIPQPPTI
eukprot:403368985